MNSQRLTLIVVNAAVPERNWTPASETTRLVFLDSIGVLRDRLKTDAELDVERVVFETGSATSLQFLSLLARFGHTFQGDMLFVSFSGGGFLSSPGRGGDRVLYELSAADLDFYLSTHKLTAHGVAPLMGLPGGDWFADARYAPTAA